jgi:hypothetical protein
MPPVGVEPTISAGERPAAAHLLRSWVQIPPGVWIFVCCECRVLSGRGLCDELITLPEKSYRLCCVVVCDLDCGILLDFLRELHYDARIHEHEKSYSWDKPTLCDSVFVGETTSAY